MPKTMSAKARKAISRAQKLRWKKVHEAQANGKTTKKTTKRRKKAAIHPEPPAYLKAALDAATANMKKQVEAMLRGTNLGVSPTWIPANGEPIPVDQLEEGHLRNAISYCARRLPMKLQSTIWLDDTRQMVEGLANLLNEAKRRGLRV